jgi:hypothetical protein
VLHSGAIALEKILCGIVSLAIAKHLRIENDMAGIWRKREDDDDANVLVDRDLTVSGFREARARKSDHCVPSTLNHIAASDRHSIGTHLLPCLLVT